MAAAYAAVVSLQHIIDNIKQQHHASHLKPLGQNPLIETLRERANFLQDFLEDYCSPAGFHEYDRDAAHEGLESRIADAAYAAEDILESHVVDRILAVYSKDRSSSEDAADESFGKSHEVDPILAGKCSSGNQHGGNSAIDDFDQRLEKVVKDMEVLLIEEEVKKMMSTEKKVRNSALPSSSSTPPPTGKNAMVGFDEYLNQVLEKLTGQGLDLQVIPIIGMGGIGKTTLARNVFVNPLIVQYFDIRAWATISQEYSAREILSCLLHEINRVPISKERGKDEIGMELRKELYGRRYLIILDDMWSVEAWDQVKKYFPDNNNGSRIMITTRISNLASHFGSNSGLNIELLDDDRSWNLFSERVFGDEDCPDLELVKLGKTIARKCKGLPLSIVTIAGLLAKSEKTQGYWEYVLENLNTIVTLDDNEYCFKILFLSYIQLPVHLKPCFLYMGVFPEDYTIRVSELIKLWVAEGFLKPRRNKSLEEVAEDCLHDLVGRNLVSVKELGSRGNIKNCTIHDLLRELCLKESQKDKFLCVSTVVVGDLKSQRRFAVHPRLLEMRNAPMLIIDAIGSMPLLRSIICEFCIPFQNYRLLRVLNTKEYPQEETLELFNSRYLDIKLSDDGDGVFPASINLFWNLQTMHIDTVGTGGRDVLLPHAIWEMPQLRHLKVDDNAILPVPSPPYNNNNNNNIVLENLQTISILVNFELTEEVLRRIPNVKKFGVECTTRCGNPVESEEEEEEEEAMSCPCLHNLDHLRKLESLFLSLDYCGHYPGYNWQQTFNFPASLKKLCLVGGELPWESITMIGVLPNLEVLKLWKDAFSGDVWNAVVDDEEEVEFQKFRSLKFLEIRDSVSPKHWTADETCFPRLERLNLESVYDLEEIPIGIGEIPTLQSIFVEGCQPSVLDSAKEILEEQRSYGNDSLQVLTRDGPITLDDDDL